MCSIITLPGFLILFFGFDVTWGIALLGGFLAGSFVLSTAEMFGICGGVIAKVVRWPKRKG